MKKTTSPVGEENKIFNNSLILRTKITLNHKVKVSLASPTSTTKSSFFPKNKIVLNNSHFCPVFCCFCSSFFDDTVEVILFEDVKLNDLPTDLAIGGLDTDDVRDKLTLAPLLSVELPLERADSTREAVSRAVSFNSDKSGISTELRCAEKRWYIDGSRRDLKFRLCKCTFLETYNFKTTCIYIENLHK